MKFITPTGLVAIAVLVYVLVCMLGCYEPYESGPVQQVEWNYKERCDILFNQDCMCIAAPHEDWQEVFGCE